MARSPRLALLACLLAASCSISAWGQSESGGAQKKSDTVALAPAVLLINNNDDIDPSGNCSPEIQKLCSDVAAGEGRLSDCLSDQIAESETASSADGVGSVSDACREDVYQYKIQRSTNINLNVPLAKACKVDAEQYCNITWFFGYKAGQVIACLRDVKDRLAPACQRQVFAIQKDAAEDYRADAQLYEACKEDAGTLCKDVKLGGGRVQGCLRDHRLQLRWACEEQLFRQEMEDADDIRLSVRLFRTCMKAKRKYCTDLQPGSARVKDCLEAHRSEPGFDPACKAELDSMIERRVRDFRLDSRLRKSCEADIYTTCAYFGDLSNMESDDSSIVRCLQDYADDITSPVCRKQVRKYQELAAEDIRFNAPLADACFADRNSFCANVPPGSARVIRCLMKSRDKLGAQCKAVLFDEEVRFSQNIDFQFPMKQSCQAEIKQYCKDMAHGDAKVIRCLQDNKSQKDFSKACREEVQQYEAEASSDYRLNFRLNQACKADVDALCPGMCNAAEGEVCGGTVLRCLTEKRADIKVESCKKEVFYFEKMEVTDYRNDVLLALACRPDVEKLCAKVEPGEGRVHECLRNARSQLSETCRKEELMLEEMEAENIELRPGLMKVCKDERAMFCRDVVPGSARMFRCLAEKMGDADFGEPCRSQIIIKLKRRQANWRLDPPLRKACKDAVKANCQSSDQQMQENGAVYKCLVAFYDNIDAGCQKELGRALHMAFFIWEPNGMLTSACDADVQQQCLAGRPNMAKTPGAVGSCLASLLDGMVSTDVPDPSVAANGAGKKPQKSLDQACQALADIAEPPDMKQAFDASLSVVLLQSQLSAVEGATGLLMLNRDRFGNARSISITGWTAVAGITALLGLIMSAAVIAFRQYHGMGNKDYTLVVKKTYGRPLF